jgi:protein with von Willebrand factor-like domain/uncharacterized protein DUF3520
MNLDDPKLTAYALGELANAERKAIENGLAKSPAAQAAVGKTRQIAEELKSAFRAELLCEHQRRNVLPLPYGRLFWSERRWPATAIAALLLASLSIAALTVWRTTRSSNPVAAAPPDSGTVSIEYASDSEPTENVAAGAEEENPFIAVSANPLSTIRFRVGTGSYPAVRKLIESGKRPPARMIRIEEMINYFDYEYPEPGPNEAGLVAIDTATCPWATQHQLVRVAIKIRPESAGQSPSFDTLVRTAQVEVTFNPTRVQSYRLIGYDSFHGAGGEPGMDGAMAEPEAQRTLTALYEVSPVANGRSAKATAGHDEMLTARMIVPHLQTFISEKTFGGRELPFAQASADFRFAAAVAEFAMILRGSAYRGSATLTDVIDWANAARANNADRSEFVECARKAQSLL